MSRRGAWLPLLLTACVPDIPPEYLLTEDPEVIGMSMTNIAPGPYSYDLSPIPVDRTRSDALPGDTVRLEALVANEDGVVDLAALQPRWFLIHGFSQGLENLVGPCDPQSPMGEDESCEIGTGASVDFVVPPPSFEPSLIDQNYQLMVIAGHEGSTQSCVERLQGEITQPTWDCILGTRFVDLGPLARLIEAAKDLGIPLVPDDEHFPIVEPIVPPELERLPPDFAPQARYLEVTQGDRSFLAWPGETSHVASGSPISLAQLGGILQRDAQRYPSVVSGGMVREVRESVHSAMHATAPFSADVYGAIAPDVTAFTVFVTVTDSRNSQSWEIYEFEVD